MLAALNKVGLPDTVADARTGELSGGQRQRVALARATVVPPRVLLCDEPTSALDVSLAATVLNLIQQLRRELGMAVVFVTHDLSVARVIADRIAVMYLGRIVEIGEAEALIRCAEAPVHQGIAGGGARLRGRSAGPQGRAGQPAVAADRLRVPPAVPDRRPTTARSRRSTSSSSGCPSAPTTCADCGHPSGRLHPTRGALTWQSPRPTYPSSPPAADRPSRPRPAAQEDSTSRSPACSALVTLIALAAPILAPYDPLAPVGQPELKPRSAAASSSAPTRSAGTS